MGRVDFKINFRLYTNVYCSTQFITIPELPEIRRCAEVLNRDLQGKYIVGLQLYVKSRYFKHGGFPGQEHLTGKILIEAIHFKGKKIIFYLQKEDGTPMWLVSSLGLEGRWLWKPESQTRLVMEIGDIKQLKRHTLKVVRRVVYYEDQRNFGELKLAATEAELAKILKAVGPDFFNDDITPELYRSKIRNKRISHWPICEWMLDQSRISSIGNYLRAEILFWARISPKRTLASLSDEDIELLRQWSIYILNESYKCGGLTIATYKDPDGTAGTYTHAVYDKDFDPEGNPVETYKDSEDRMVHWVPAVQK